jgi:hypothetical protein
VYLDIFGSNNEGQQEKQIVAPEVPKQENKNPEEIILVYEAESVTEATAETQEFPNFVAENKSATVYQAYKKKPFNPLLVILLSGAALIVLIGGILLKYRN